MQKIIPNLWFDHAAQAAVDFYVDTFPDVRRVDSTRYPAEGLPDFQREFAGHLLTIDFTIRGQRFAAINAGPEFGPTPAISFFVNFDPGREPNPRGQLDELWERLSDGGTTLMPLQEYPFSPRYGWVQDRFGVSWQLMESDPSGDPRPLIVPSLLFCGSAQNRAHEAMEFYAQTFPGYRSGTKSTYERPTGPAPAGAIAYADFAIGDTWVAAMDSGVAQPFTFTEGVSLVVECAGQEEIDRLWNRLSYVSEAEACGWCKDQFGVSWQIVPHNIAELMKRPGAYQRLLEMKKIVVAQL